MSDTQLNVAVPGEPPDGSVILDRARRAWQRRGSAWYMAGALPSLFAVTGAAKWPWLLLDCGPVTPLWTPSTVGAAEQTDDDTAPIAEEAAAADVTESIEAEAAPAAANGEPHADEEPGVDEGVRTR